MIGADHVPARKAVAATDRREDADAQDGEVPAVALGVCRKGQAGPDDVHARAGQAS